MTDLPPVYPGMITIEETQFKAAVSEYTAQRMGSFFNFLATTENSEKQFFINGGYGKSVIPFNGIDGMTMFPFDAEIFDVLMFSNEPGSSGTTEIDLKVSPTPGAAFVSIFSTTPKIDSTAIAFARITTGSTLSGCVTPIFTSGVGVPILLTAGTAIRCDLLQAMVGGRQTGIVAYYRPR